MEVNNIATKYDEWKDRYSWAECKTNREEYGKFLCDFITSSKEGSVINLDGVWGAGKTELLRRMYIELASRKHPVIYIDSWESDFSSNALAVVCSEILSQLEHALETRAPKGKATKQKEALNKLSVLKEQLSSLLKLTGAAFAMTGNQEGVAVAKVIETAVDVVPKKKVTKQSQLVEIVQANHVNSIQALKDIKELSSFIAELLHEIYEVELPVVILVDELDRCRPTYAIEMLEVIKHFFEAKGFTFLVATNTEALQHSIGAVYGAGFNSEDYLRRFFSRKIKIPKVSVLDYLQVRTIDLERYIGNGIKLVPFTQSFKYYISMFAEIFEGADLDLRTIEQCITQFEASLGHVHKNNRNEELIFNPVVLMAGIVENIKGHNNFNSRGENQPISCRWSRGAYVRNHPDSLADNIFNLVAWRNTREIHDMTGGSGGIMHAGRKELSVCSQANKNYNHIGNKEAIEGFNSAIESYRNDSENYWLWSKYKQLIELSSHIEV